MSLPRSYQIPLSSACYNHLHTFLMNSVRIYECVQVYAKFILDPVVKNWQRTISYYHYDLLVHEHGMIQD